MASQGGGKSREGGFPAEVHPGATDLTDLRIVGSNVPRVDALEKVTGRAEFAITFRLPGMLHGKVVRSPYAFAKIIHIDSSRAEKVTGVRVVATAINTPPIRLGGFFKDRGLFPIDLVVRHVGDAVAALAAETEEAAEEAARLVDVEYEELRPVLDVEEAFETQPPSVIHPDLPHYWVNRTVLPNWQLDPEKPNVCQHFQIRHGHVEKGFQESDFIVENHYSTPRIHHAQIEPCVSVAWFEADRTLRLKTSAQGVSWTKAAICDAFELPADKVRVEAPYVGGGFGGKGRNIAEPFAVLLSMRAGGRPVRVCFSRAEHFCCSRSRVPVKTYMKDGLRKDGTILAREIRILVNMGAYADQSIVIAKYCAFGAVGTYRAAHFKLDSYGVYTNTPMSGPFRGFGNAEVIWAVENQMDVIAHELGLDPVEVRKRNLLKEGERDCCGQMAVSIGAKECLEKVSEWIGWNKESSEPAGSWKKGKGIALGNKNTATGITDNAFVKILPEGPIEVYLSSDEVGMGVKTVMAQIVAERFGTTVDRVKVISGDTALCPSGWPPVSSHTTFSLGNAVIAACEDAKRQLLEIASAKWSAPLDSLTLRAEKIFVGDSACGVDIREVLTSATGDALSTGGLMTGKGTFQIVPMPEDPETGQGERMVAYYTQGAHAVEVAVDTETGMVRILRSGACFDVGNPIHPKMCEGQIECGIAMGLGSALYEELLIDDQGEILNPNFRDYRIPTASDMPHNANVSAMLASVPHPEGPYGAKGVGEAVMIPYAPAVSNAIYHAVGIRINDLPLTCEKILKALKEKERRERNSKTDS